MSTRRTWRIVVPWAAEWIITGVRGDDADDALARLEGNGPGLCAYCSQHYTLAIDGRFEDATVEEEAS